MVTAATIVSRIGAHIGIAFSLMYTMTGSISFGGLVALMEPICNVGLMPVHERIWERYKRGKGSVWRKAMKKTSQLGLHMSVAFVLIFAATGSLTLGWIGALAEPLANVLLMPVHDRIWRRLRTQLAGNAHTISPA